MSVAARVFISYAWADGEDFASGQLLPLIERAKLESWLDRKDRDGGPSLTQQIKEAIDRAPAVVLVLTPAALQSRWVRTEWLYARQQGVRVVPVKGDPAVKPDGAGVPRWMSRAPWYDLTNEYERENFLRLLHNPERLPRVKFMAPALPADFVKRPQEFDKLKGMLLDPERGDPVAITTALQGAGGFGKTTLAAALCHDDDVKLAFGDGILWVTLGEKPGLVALLNDLCTSLTDRNPGFSEVGTAANRLAELLDDRDCLVVLDDVWDQGHLEPFLRGGKTCARLVTTRRRAVVTEAGASRVDVDEMTTDQAAELLLSRITPRPANRQPIEDLARRLGEWPVLLSQFNGHLRQRLSFGQSLTVALAAINEALDRKGVTVLDPKKVAERHSSVTLTIEVSLDQLGDDERSRYTELAIFPEDEAVTLTAIAALWGMDAIETETLTLRLGDLALIKLDLNAQSIRLHDVMRHYLAGRLAGPAGVHARLLDAWGDLRHLPDAYAWRHYAHHLAGAGRLEELKPLLLDYTWLRAKLNRSDAIALRDDAARFPDDRDFRLLARALEQSAHILAKDPAALRGQLHGRLMGISSPVLEEFLKQIRVVENEGAWLRPLQPGLTPADSPLVRIFQIPGRGFTALAVTSDGRWAVSGSSDGAVRLWDLQGQESRELGRHGSGVSSVALTSDGRWAVSGSSDGAVRLWDLQGQQSRELGRHGDCVRSVALTSDGRWAVSGSDDGAVRLWDLQGQASRELGRHGSGVESVALTWDGRWAVSGSSDGAVRLWDLQGQQSRELGRHGSPVSSVALTWDGRWAVSGSSDGAVRLWDLQDQASRELSRHGSGVESVAFTWDGRWAVSGSSDGAVRLWDLQGQQSRELGRHGSRVRSVALTSDGRGAVSGSSDGAVRLWDLQGQASRELGRHGSGVESVAFTWDGRWAVSGSRDGAVRLWDLQGQESRELGRHRSLVSSVAVTSDGRWAVSGSYDGAVRLWDLQGQASRELGRHDRRVNSVALTWDGLWAVSGSSDGAVRLWDLQGQASRELGRHGSGVSSVALTWDGRWAVSGSARRCGAAVGLREARACGRFPRRRSGDGMRHLI